MKKKKNVTGGINPDQMVRYKFILDQARQKQKSVQKRRNRRPAVEDVAEKYAAILTVFSGYCDPNKSAEDWIPACIDALHKRGFGKKLKATNIKKFWAFVGWSRTKLKKALEESQRADTGGRSLHTSGEDHAATN